MKQKEIFSNASFVRGGDECISPRFRGKFTAAAGEKTEITVCGLGFFRMFINGKRADDSVLAPVFSFYHTYEGCYCEAELGEKLASRIYCMKYDITELIRDGENTVAVEVGPGWYNEFKSRCVLCYRIVSGKKEFFSGSSVKWSDSPLTFFNFHKGEKQDHTKPCLSDDWILPDYDDSGWEKSIEVEMPDTEYYIQDCANDKVIRSVKPLLIGETDEHYIYDVGENITGTYVFSCPEKGKKVCVAVSEELDAAGFPHEDWIHGQNAEFITDGSDKEYKLLFTWHAFRYFMISKGTNVLRVDVIHSDIPVISDFKCENKVLNWLFDAYIRTQLCNMHAGIPSDCPHLERRGYTGDGQLTCEAAMLMLDSEKFYRKWMEDIEDCQDRNSGNIQYTAPYWRCGGGPGGWGCAIAEVPYIFWKTYGDISPANKYFDPMLKYVAYLEAHSEGGLVTSGQPTLWCLGDWCTPHQKHGMKPEIPEPFVNTYFLIRMLDRMIELAGKTGRENEIPVLTEKRGNAVKALADKYYDAESGDFANDLNSANAFALDIGLGDERTLQSLVNKVRTEPLDTGIFGTDLVAKILFEKGYFDEAVDFLSREEYPSFGFMMRSGATTLWEEWRDPRSMSHPMFGSAVKYLFMHILGIRRKDGTCGYDDIVIEPKTNDITGDASGYIETPKGRISVSVSREKNECTVSVPENIKCEIIFEGIINRI